MLSLSDILGDCCTLLDMLVLPLIVAAAVMLEMVHSKEKQT